MKVVRTSKKSYLVKDIDADFHCDAGMITKADLQKSHAKTNTGVECSIFDASFIDVYAKMHRTAQIISLKEIGAIISTCGLGKDSIVVDAGSGSGALACFLANIVKNVHTYDIHESHLATTRKNIELFGLKNVDVKEHDVTTGIPKKNVDVVVLDLPEPSAALEHAAHAVKHGGFVVVYSPNTTQLQAVSQRAKDILSHEKTIELIEREWVIDEKRSRPSFARLGHTGFLAFYRKDVI